MGKKPAKSESKAKQKPTAQKKNKKHHADYDSLRDPLDRELALIGLRVKNITADGNCFFRALSDQLQGDESSHSSLRARVVALMTEREEDFAPFVEDDQSFETYIARMKKEGIWAGHMELQAASLLLSVNIAVYQAGQPRWAVTNFPPGSRQLHLSYHDGQHYNSIRRADDYSSGGPPASIDEGALATVENASELQQSWSAADEAAVAAGTGCDNLVLLRQQLAAAQGDVDTAIEAIIEILAGEDSTGVSNELTGTTAGSQQIGAAEGPGGQLEAGQQQQQQQEVTAAQGVVVRTTARNATPPTYGLMMATTETAVVSCSHGRPTAAAAGDRGDSDCARCSGGDSDGPTIRQEAPCAASSTLITPLGAEALETPPPPQPPCTTTSGGANSMPAVLTGSKAVSKGSPVKPVKGVKLKGTHQRQLAGKTATVGGGGGGRGAPAAAGEERRPSRNKPCSCGSGRKHKNCCGLKSSCKSSSKDKGQGDGEGVLPRQMATLHI